MKVSVIVPAFNEEKRIEDILYFALSQSYYDFEVIIVDNNSTDSTRKKAIDFLLNHEPKNVVRYNDQFICDIGRIKFRFVTEYKRGTNYAREKGRKIATGDILAFVDADCRPSTDWVENGVELLRKPNMAAASGAYYFYDDKPIRRFLSLYTQQILYIPISFILQLFKKGAIMNGGNMFIDARAFDLLRGFNTEFSFYGDDVDTAIRLSRLGKVPFSPSITMPTSSRRFKELGFSKTNKKNTSTFLKMVFGKSLSENERQETLHPR